MATRSHILAVRKREDEEFRRLTESAEIEEEVGSMCHARQEQLKEQYN